MKIFKRLLVVISIICLIGCSVAVGAVLEDQVDVIEDVHETFIPDELYDLYTGSTVLDITEYDSLEDFFLCADGCSVIGAGSFVLVDEDEGSILLITQDGLGSMVGLWVSFDRKIFGNTDYWLEAIFVVSVEKEVIKTVEFDGYWLDDEAVSLDADPVELGKALGKMKVEDFITWLDEVGYFDMVPIEVGSSSL